MMGLSRIGMISKKLIDGGMDKDMPVAVIQNLSPSQIKIIRGTISNIANKIKRNKIKPPTNIIIGRVVDLSDIIGWKK